MSLFDSYYYSMSVGMARQAEEARKQMKQELEIQKLKEEIAVLRHEIALLRPRKTESDIYGERAVKLVDGFQVKVETATYAASSPYALCDSKTLRDAVAAARKGLLTYIKELQELRC